MLCYCKAEIMMYQQNGEVAFRRNYLMTLGDDYDADAVCAGQASADLGLAVLDLLMCLYLSVHTAYIGYSYLESLAALLASYGAGGRIGARTDWGAPKGISV
jgi:hypothetical protein